MKRIPIIILALITIASCEKKDLSTDLSELLTGDWTHISYTDTIYTLEKVDSLPEDEYGISFRKKNELMEWKNTGWCGTPPLAYGEHLGTWEVTVDSVITVDAVFWGGNELNEYKIISIDNKELKYYIKSHKTYHLID